MQRLSKSRKTMILTLVALIVIGGSLGLLFAHANQLATQNAQATSTAFSERAQTQSASTNIASTATARVALATAQVVGATVQAQTQAQATATANAITALNPDPSFHTLALYDSLISNSNGWDENGITGSGCMFEGDGYHTTSSVSGFVTFCLLRNHSFSDFVYLAHMKILKGDCGGLVFHSTDSASSNYYIDVCQDGRYNFVREQNNVGTILLSGSNSAINQGLNKTNAVAVAVRGSAIDLFINRVHVLHTTDSVFKSGDIGMLTLKDLAPGSGQNVLAETAYSNLYIWTA